MAVQEIAFKTSVDTGTSAADVKKVSQEVENANESLQDTFDNLRKKIQANDKEIEQLSKAYDKNEKAIKKLESANKELNQQYDQLSKTGTDLNATWEDMHGEIQPLTTRIGEMEDRMHQLTMEGQSQSQEFLDLRDKVVQYKKAIVDTDRAVDQLVEQGSGLGTALQLGETVAAGYGALQGAMALVGGENEDLQKTFVKLQAIQSILAGLEQLRLNLNKQSLLMTKAQAIGNKVLTVSQIAYTAAVGATTGAMKILRIAMLAIPLLAIIAGIAALVGWIVSLFSETEKAEAMNNRLTASFEKQADAMERSQDAYMRDIDNKIRMAKANNATQEEMHQLELERLRREEANRKRTMAFDLKQIKRRKEAYEQAKKEENDELARSIKDQINQSRKRYRDLKELDGQYLIDKKILETEYDNDKKKREAEQEKEDTDKAKKAYEDWKKREEEKARLQMQMERKIRDLMIASIKDEDIQRRMALKERHEREREDLIAQYGENTNLMKALTRSQAKELADLDAQIEKRKEEELKKQNEKQRKIEDEKHKKMREGQKAQLEGELIQMREDFEARIAVQKELAELEMQIALEQEDLTEGEKFKIKQEYAQKIKELDTEVAEHNEEVNRMAFEQRVKLEEQALSTIESLGNAVFDIRKRNLKEGSKAEEDEARRRFQFNKAVQLGGALIDAQKAITASLAQAPVAIGGIPNPAGIASLTFAIAQSGAAIASILATQFQPGGTGGGSGSSTSVSAPNIPTAGEDQGVSTLTSGLPGSGQSTGGGNTTFEVKLVDSVLKAQMDNSAKNEAISGIE